MIVLDASVTLAALFQDEFSSYADVVLAEVENQGASVPFVWPVEVVSGILRAERRGRIDPQKRAEFIRGLQSLSLLVDVDGVARTFADVLAIAVSENISPYDACYLELALRQARPIATVDENMRRAAQKLGLSLVAPP